MTHTKKEVTGRLEGWVRDPYKAVVWGYLFDDVHKRWEDGIHIHTSHIEDFSDLDLKEGDVVTTANSTYLLGKELKIT